MNTKICVDRCSHRRASRIISLVLSLAMMFTVIAGLDMCVYAETTYHYNELADGTLEISLDETTEKIVTVPSQIDGKTVTVIGDYGLNGSGDMPVEEYILPDTLKVISMNAFAFCDYLKRVHIPAGVVEIGNNIFSDCPSLTTVTVDKNNKVYDSRDNCNAVIETATNTLIAGCGTSTVPKTVERIENFAFMFCETLKSIELPEGLKTIGFAAFDETGLVNVVVPKSVEKIESTAFYGCASLETFEFYNTMQEIEDSVFEYCDNLKTVYFHGSGAEFENMAIWEYNNECFFNADIYYNGMRFKDLGGYEYYNDFVKYTSVYNEFLKGTNPPENNVFEPARAIDRAMMVTILYRMAGEPYANGNPYRMSPFTDITDTSVYYYDAACWALENGVTTETTFKPFNNVTREQTATFLYRYAQDNDKLGDADYKNVNLNDYHDGNSISHFAVDAMKWANYNSMITGTEQGYANPQGATQRIHATKILYGFGKTCNIGNFA